MISVSCKEIIMGKQSCLGPFDPQMNGVPCQSAIKEFKQAVQDVKDNPSSLGLWQTIISRYTPTFLYSCQQAVALSDEISKKILKKTIKEENLAKVLKLFGDNSDCKTHSRHINKKQCQEAGLNIVALEDNQEFQDLVLSIHHSLMILLDRTPTVKIVKNNLGGCYIKNAAMTPTPPTP